MAKDTDHPLVVSINEYVEDISLISLQRNNNEDDEKNTWLQTYDLKP